MIPVKVASLEIDFTLIGLEAANSICSVSVHHRW